MNYAGCKQSSLTNEIFTTGQLELSIFISRRSELII